MMSSKLLSGLIVSAALFSTPVLADTVATQITKLTGSCRTAVEKKITNLGEGEATVDDVIEVKGAVLNVTYSRESEDSQITGEAQVRLKIIKQTVRGQTVRISKCKVLAGEILSESGD